MGFLFCGTHCTVYLDKKEASDKSHKSDILMDLACSTSTPSFEQNIHHAERYSSQDIMILH